MIRLYKLVFNVFCFCLISAYANWLSETFTKLGDEFETAYKEHKPEIEELVKDVKHEVSKTSKKFKKLVEKGKEVHENVADEIKDTVKKAAQKFKEKLPNDIPGKKKEIIRKWVKLVQQFVSSSILLFMNYISCCLDRSLWPFQT